MSFPLGQVVFRLVCFSVAYLFYLRYDFAVPTYFLLFRTCIIDNGCAEKRCWSRSCSAEERNSGILFERLFTSFFGMSRKLGKKATASSGISIHSRPITTSKTDYLISIQIGFTWFSSLRAPVCVYASSRMPYKFNTHLPV